ncbi:hypothetical protein [Methylobacterium sp. J-077]|uniref:hypothetical protein n=1 Tax=Methylobacterium sp. J-077 TaxID=2836656 RepID=UPI001FB88884|nr:hypothetical protein [Methylobacterium sp. J-077]MCJ2124893.1 hypothetical protein [Methylobacterium sp. J-077]
MAAGYQSELSSEELEEATRLMELKGSYGAVGDAVYAALTPEDRAHLVEAMWHASRSIYDDWRCALGNAGVGLPIREYDGNDPEDAQREEPITDEHVRTMCSFIADVKVDYWTDESDWDYFLRGAFGQNRDRYRPLYDSVPLGDDGTQPRRGRR